ncbi:BamA/TamA family outer membrane protein [Aquamicrobium lusatiense]|uniref:BamA/TamA family outer membrane protein n=1 Tax=Aquamicrobium lusatiense TaxID=89772 RepID=UPI0024567F64|nr:BamA/TamA family outer membrane protein [Aquamicrobium lusatiense]MDH4990620.1 BamA/TamA family outer membrane protein [Aquamicrobium lusatiense]
MPFIDAGTVSAKQFPEFSDTVKVGAGIGVRYLTPFGPAACRCRRCRSTASRATLSYGYLCGNRAVILTRQDGRQEA